MTPDKPEKEVDDKCFLPPEADRVPNLVRRYQAVALRIWRLFPSDSLPDDDHAQFWIERLESILDRGLLQAKVEGDLKTLGETK